MIEQQVWGRHLLVSWNNCMKWTSKKIVDYNRYFLRQFAYNMLAVSETLDAEPSLLLKENILVSSTDRTGAVAMPSGDALLLVWSEVTKHSQSNMADGAPAVQMVTRRMPNMENRTNVEVAKEEPGPTTSTCSNVRRIFHGLQYLLPHAYNYKKLFFVFH